MFGQVQCPNCGHYQVKGGCLAKLVGLAVPLVALIGLFFFCLWVAFPNTRAYILGCAAVALAFAGFGIIALAPLLGSGLLDPRYECEFCGKRWGGLI